VKRNIPGPCGKALAVVTKRKISGGTRSAAIEAGETSGAEGRSGPVP
jgi:hypothetical protein